MSAEKKRILEMIEAGVITASEGLTLLEALEKENQTGYGGKEKKDNFFDELASFGQKFAGQMGGSQSGSSFNQPKDKLFQFVQSTVQKLKDFELPLGKAVEFSHEFHEANCSPVKIKAEAASGNLTIKPWDEPGVKAECQVKVYGADSEDEAREAFIKNSVFYAREDKLSFSIGLKLMKVDTVLYVPQSAYDEISVKLFSGSFSMRDAEVRELEVKAANGKIEVKNSRIDQFEGETGNGQIYLIDCTGKKAEANSFYGAVHVVGTFGFTDIKSFNGNILCDVKSGAAHTVKTQAVTGNIEIYVPDTVSMKGELRTNLGSLQLPETGMKRVTEKEEMVQKLVRFESEHEALERVAIEAETRTGSVVVKTVGTQPKEKDTETPIIE
ncbi:DUF4097 and DUF4098 domain-containing protein YvlB [Bacillus ectoiniformans]|uniref:DUF4097 family beta strand repeat-containing protein n=1 Tax=Bacillus ectoiniformans TaxID=1494429 RepID=UPI001958EFC4|nr:DUF4097 family beta strand repeat-containing protein [Bacillus ectoiniformans]MBM7648768.1 DUF4097 and DUF4098 domain-containing protein YvlB [Bacillus ectoiniformans]